MTRATLAGCAVVALALATARGQSPPEGATAPAHADRSSHRSAFVARDGVRLHYLDWGGTGPVVVLLPGYALTAHAYDDVGRLRARDFRVLAVTPRGIGESDAPPDSAGYTVATMVADLRAVLDSLGVQRAALVGHSMSGATIAEFALAHPDRVTRLVFLDAYPYWAAVNGDSVSALSPVEGHRFTGEMTYPRVRRFLETYRFGGWNDALEADLRANVLGAELERRRALTAGYISDQGAHPPDLGKISVPALEICAMPSVATDYPWLRSGTAAYARAERFVREVQRPFGHTLCERFAATVPGGRTREVTGSHYVFFTRPALTAELVRQFLRK